MKKIIISMALSAVCLLIGLGSFAVNDVAAYRDWGRQNAPQMHQWAQNMTGFCQDFISGQDDHSPRMRRDDDRDRGYRERTGPPDPAAGSTALTAIHTASRLLRM